MRLSTDPSPLEICKGALIELGAPRAEVEKLTEGRRTDYLVQCVVFDGLPWSEAVGIADEAVELDKKEGKYHE